MKKILFALAILLVAVSLSACTAGEEPVTPQNTVQDEALNLADDKKTPAPATSTESAPATQTPAGGLTAQVLPKIMLTPDKQENLLAKYSQAVFKTSEGNITVKFYNADSPQTVNNFLNLAQAGFYDGTKFHRVITDFMIQGGDPNSKDDDWSNDGTGGPGYKFADEFNSHKLVAGSLAMANSGPNTNGSQFFIVTAASTPWLDGKHTNFGQVVSGMEIVKKIEMTAANANDHPLEDMVINSIELLK